MKLNINEQYDGAWNTRNKNNPKSSFKNWGAQNTRGRKQREQIRYSHHHHHHNQQQHFIRLLNGRPPTTLPVSSKPEQTQHISSHLSRTDTCNNLIFQKARGSWPTDLSHFTIPVAVSWRLLPANWLSRFAVVQRSVGPAAWIRSVPTVVRYYYYYYYYYYYHHHHHHWLTRLHILVFSVLFKDTAKCDVNKNTVSSGVSKHKHAVQYTVQYSTGGADCDKPLLALPSTWQKQAPPKRR